MYKVKLFTLKKAEEFTLTKEQLKAFNKFLQDIKQEINTYFVPVIHNQFYDEEYVKKNRKWLEILRKHMLEEIVIVK